MVNKSKALTSAFLLAFTIAIFIANIQYPSLYLKKILYSTISITITYLIFQIFLDEYASKRIKHSIYLPKGTFNH